MKFRYNKIQTILFLLLPLLTTAQKPNFQLLYDSAQYYYQKTDYQTALLWGVMALKQAENQFGKMDTNYANTLTILSDIHYYTGNYKKSEKYNLEEIEIRKEIQGESHPYYGESLNNLAVLYEKMGRYQQAEELYLQTINIDKKQFGEEHLLYAQSINNLAVLYKSIGRYQKAEELLLKSKDIRKKLLGEKHPDYAQSLHNLAGLYISMGHSTCDKSSLDRYQQAQQLLSRSINIRKKNLGDKHPQHITSLYFLAGLYEKLIAHSAKRKEQKKFSENSEFYFKQALDKTIFLINTNFPSMSEKERGKYFNLLKGRFERYYSFITSPPPKLPESENRGIGETENAKAKQFTDSPIHPYTDSKRKEGAGEVFNYRLSTKALLLNSSNKVRDNILNSGDTVLIQKYRQWKSRRDYLAKLYTLSKAEIERQGVIIKELEKEANDMEKELSKRSQDFRNLAASRIGNPG